MNIAGNIDPNRSDPNRFNSDVSKLEGSKPDGLNPNVSNPDVSNPDLSHTDASHTDGVKPVGGNGPIMFYDGDCVVCNGGVKFVAKHNSSFKFAAIGGETFLAQVPAEKQSECEDTVTVLDTNGELYDRYGAALFVLSQCNQPWRTFGKLGTIIPVAIGDRFYNLLARNRYRAGKVKSTCSIPEAKLRIRLLP